MSQLETPLQKQQTNHKAFWFVLAFLLIAAAGLFYIKWWPYYHKSILAANTHLIGSSILGDLSNEAPSWQAGLDYAIAYFKSVWKAAILGIVLGSLIQVLIPTQWLLKVLGKTSFGSTAIAGLASVPGMMCTCCAAPMAVGLRKKNVSVGAALAFWIGNPMLNPATLIFMTFVLSWKFTLMRLLFGIILTFGISYIANRFVKETPKIDIEQMIDDSKQEGSFMFRWLRSLGTMVLYIVPAYVLSVLLLGAGRVWLFPQLSEAGANSLLAIIIFALAGMLFVIPTAAEIPIVQTFMTLGIIGGGPAAALLVTLPAISLPSLIMVAKSFPKKVLLFVIASVVVLGMISGFVGKFIL